MINLGGQNVLITGGGRGLGAATAVAFAKAGAGVGITYSSDRKSAEKIVNSIKQFGVRGVCYRLKVQNYSDCQKVIRTVMNDFGNIDILVNNAGIWEYGAIGKMSPKNWNKTIDINLTGIFNMCNLIIPFMKKRRCGRIINISSTAGQRGEAFHSHYAASKGGTIAFTKSIAIELIRSGIVVNCVAPGWIDTDMVSGTLRNRKAKKEILHSIPRGKIGKPEEIAGSIVFLASSLSDNIIGEILNVNGGSVLCG